MADFLYEVGMYDEAVKCNYYAIEIFSDEINLDQI